MNWREEAVEHNIPLERVERAAKGIYNANWKELPNHRFPPIWENTSDEVRDFVRRQAVRALSTL